MNLESNDREKLNRASNVLLLAPLAPTSDNTCLELLGAMAPPGRANVLAVTYTPSPETWIDDWRSHFERLPTELAFIHANTVGTTVEGEETALPLDVRVSRVDPTQPMDIVAPVSEQLTRWQTNDNESFVSMQSLTVLLEYVEFDTAFRYLHILTHRVQASGASGFYHMDPSVHDAQTINTLKSLFDAVVMVSGDRKTWTVTETYNRDATGERHDTSDGLLASIRTSLSNVVPGSSDTESTTASRDIDDDGVPEKVLANLTDSSSPDTHHEDLSDAAMLTDEDRIRELLTQYGGRMKQADVTEETEWSKSTVSRKLSEMEEKGLVTRVQVGRGNLVFLNGYEPKPAQSSRETR